VADIHKPGSTWTIDKTFDGDNYSHIISLPSNYDFNKPSPLLLYFHGWTGSASDCGRYCSQASEQGFVTVSLTGMGDPSIGNSWNGFGSTKSPGPDGKICNDKPSGDYCYKDCGVCGDECWWTTCKDSVG